MVLHVIRGVFLFALLAIAVSYVIAAPDAETEGVFAAVPREAIVLGVLGIGALTIGLDILISKKSLLAISGLFIGLLAGLVFAYVFAMVIDLVVEVSGFGLREAIVVDREIVGFQDAPALVAIKLLVGVLSCYFAISFVLQTKDDIRFIIPYVEFEKKIKGGRPIILDTSVIIDGRIADIAQTRIFDNPLIVPRFVLVELQQVADSQDRLKRNRGRRGLDIVNKLQGQKDVDLTIHDDGSSRGPVDQRLVALAEEMHAKIMTTDYNLNKVAQIRGVEVVNINDLTNSLKSVVLPGEALAVKIVKAGEESGQGVGYLEDGTMVVIEGGRSRIGQTVNITITSSLQTSAGRMIFGKTEDAGRDSSRRNHNA